MMRVLFLIIARGGSTGIPKKNLAEIAGISLVGFKAASARKSKYCSRLILSSDCPDIQSHAKSLDVEVPFTRPAELASSSASSEDVVLHAMEYVEEECGEDYDAVMLLEPSSPFATHVDYDSAVEMMLRTEANVVVGVREVEVNSVFVGPMDSGKRISSIVNNLIELEDVRRQSLEKEYTLNGALYLLRWDFFKKMKKRYCDPEKTYGLLMDRYYSGEIDEPIDLEFSRFLVEKNKIDMSYWRD